MVDGWPIDTNNEAVFGGLPYKGILALWGPSMMSSIGGVRLRGGEHVPEY